MTLSPLWPSGGRCLGLQKAVRIMLLAASIGRPGCVTARKQPAFLSTAARSRAARTTTQPLSLFLDSGGFGVSRCLQPRIRSDQRSFTSSRSSLKPSSPSSLHGGSAINQDDINHMARALDHAKLGLGQTFPNPAVGCVLVRQDTNEVVGEGFHPRAGFPHAEVFALLEAAGHVESGVAAAQAVVDIASLLSYASNRKNNDNLPTQEQQELFEKVLHLTEIYSSQEGPQELFAPDKFSKDVSLVAYVTLEPCCHTGRTPPCAASLVATGVVSRVVVGVRDPNPRVDGGGVQMLKDAKIDVDMFLADTVQDDADNKLAAERVHLGLNTIVADFFKRITPRTPPTSEESNENNNDFYSYINGAKRRALRSYSMRKKGDNSLTKVDWYGETIEVKKESSENLEVNIQSLDLDPSWLERIDSLLWEKEVVLLCLSKAIKKKKGAKFLGERVAQELQAHVAQTLGHTVLLYRPGIPPVLDLATLGRQDK